MNKRLVMVSAVLMSLNALPVMAESEDMSQMDHSNMSGMEENTTQDNGHSQMPGMDHGTSTEMDHSKMPHMDHETTHKMDSGTSKKMDHSQASSMEHNTNHEMDHSKMPGMDHGSGHEMDHSEMQGMEHSGSHDMSKSSMQGGSAPADARDPHAYSGGYTIDSGKYALPGPRILKLGDEHNFASLLVDRLEAARASDDTSTVYDLQAWYGRDYDRAVFKAEGHIEDGKLEEGSTELLWGHALSAYWNTNLGVRYDSNEETDRSWLAFGVQGLAPYWFEIDATAYIGEEGRSALSFEAEYELLFTQKLILQPRIEANFYGKDDTDNGIGAGLSELAVGVRLRYEIEREFGPYIGVEWESLQGDTASMARNAGLDTKETKAVAGVRFWF